MKGGYERSKNSAGSVANDVERGLEAAMMTIDCAYSGQAHVDGML